MELLPNDIWTQIFQVVIYKLRLGSLYKNLIFLNKRLNKIGQIHWNDAVDLLSNHLMTLILMYPDVSWDWNQLSKNPNITFEHVKTHLNWRWNGISLSNNPNITYEITESYSVIYWDYGYLQKIRVQHLILLKNY